MLKILNESRGAKQGMLETTLFFELIVTAIPLLLASRTK
jgi:hypothetical protein